MAKPTNGKKPAKAKKTAKVDKKLKDGIKKVEETLIKVKETGNKQ